MEEINILICSPGDRHEDCIPDLFVSLDKLKQTLNKIKLDNEDGSTYYLFVLIANKRVTLNNIDDCDIHLDIGVDYMWMGHNYSDQCTYEQLESKIIEIAHKKTKS